MALRNSKFFFVLYPSTRKQSLLQWKMKKKTFTVTCLYLQAINLKTKLIIFLRYSAITSRQKQDIKISKAALVQNRRTLSKTLIEVRITCIMYILWSYEEINKNRPQSDIFEHSVECNTHVKPENFKILDTLQTENGLLLLESLYQKTQKPIIGKQQQSTPLMSFD